MTKSLNWDFLSFERDGVLGEKLKAVADDSLLFLFQPIGTNDSKSNGSFSLSCIFSSF